MTWGAYRRPREERTRNVLLGVQQVLIQRALLPLHCSRLVARGVRVAIHGARSAAEQATQVRALQRASAAREKRASRHPGGPIRAVVYKGGARLQVTLALLGRVALSALGLEDLGAWRARAGSHHARGGAHAAHTFYAACTRGMRTLLNVARGRLSEAGHL